MNILSERYVLITGAGSGIGAATAHLFAHHGWNVLALGRNKELLTDVLSTSPHGNHRSLCADVRSRTEIHNALESASVPHIDAVFMSAGISKENNYFDNDIWDDIIAVNLTGSYNTFFESLPYLRLSPQKFKYTLFVSSVVARFGVPYHSAYSAAKSGVLGLMRSVAAEFAPEGIISNAMCPGWVATSMADESIGRLASRSGRSLTHEAAFQQSLLPLQRMSTPQEIAETAYFLLSGIQQSIAGQAIDINNGAYFAP
jgi:NAD(P)-dependent dehydrogenase (short-subunit alcohol dehydrogenase family)